NELFQRTVITDAYANVCGRNNGTNPDSMANHQQPSVVCQWSPGYWPLNVPLSKCSTFEMPLDYCKRRYRIEEFGMANRWQFNNQSTRAQREPEEFDGAWMSPVSVSP